MNRSFDEIRSCSILDGEITAANAARRLTLLTAAAPETGGLVVRLDADAARSTGLRVLNAAEWLARDAMSAVGGGSATTAGSWGVSDLRPKGGRP